MAADTAAKRRSAMLLTMPFRGPPYPQATLDAGERAAGLFLYALPSTTASTVGPPQYIAGVPSSDLTYIDGVPTAGITYTDGVPAAGITYTAGVPDSGITYIAGVPDADDDYIVGS